MRITEAQAKEIVRNSYDPTECESCDVQGSACWECIDDALDGFIIV